MFRIFVFVLLIFAMAFGFVWLANNPGTVTVQWDWLSKGEAYELDLTTLIVVLGAVFIASVFSWWSVASVINSPKNFGRWRSGRRRDKGYTALSKGLVAAGAGNIPLAKQLARESGKLLKGEPLVAMLEAQTALLEDDRPSARQQFNAMLGQDDTRLLGLRGLYLEAEKEGAVEAAAHFSREANELAPGTPWAAKAVLKVQTISKQWQEALKTLELNRSSGIFTKDAYNRKRAVVLTAFALELEDPDPEQARIHALAACKLAPDLVPAGTLAARLLVRLNDTRKAGKILETTWRVNPHPEIIEAYANLIAGESAAQRLKRVEKLNAKDGVPCREGQFALAGAALDAGEFKQARDAMEQVLREPATERACLLMADIEQAQYGDRGRVREWLSRAVSAAKDPVWIADGVVAAQWAACSPMTGRLDAFEWKAPMQQLDDARDVLDLSRLAHEPPIDPGPDEKVSVSGELGDGEDTLARPSPDSASDAIDAESLMKETRASSIENDRKRTNGKSEAQTSVVDDSGNNGRVAETESAPQHATVEGVSPYGQTNLDQNQDGVIDHRPDDPGIGPGRGKEGTGPKNKGWPY